MSKKEISLFDGKYNDEYIIINDKQIRDGKGKMTYKNGDVYDGEWKNNEKHGKGTMTYGKDGDVHKKYINGVYEGDWINDQKWGKGKMTYTKNDRKSVYEGKWAFDKKVKPETTFSKVSNYFAEITTPSIKNVLYGGLNKRKTYRKTRRNKSKKNKSSKKK